MLSGYAGFLFGGNLSPNLASVGASGSLYGILACVFIDLIFNFKLIQNRWRELIKFSLTVLVSFAIGLLPMIDNFSHIGGFIVGLLTGFLILPQVSE